MGGDLKKEEKKEETEDIKNDGITGPQERGSGNQDQMISKSDSNRKSTCNEQYGLRKPSQSRSCSKVLRKKKLKSANAFINFMRDFRQGYNDVKSKDLLRIGGQKWRQMSPREKLPYVEAAKQVQQKSKQKKKNEQQTNNKPNSVDITKKSDNEQEKKEQKKKKETKDFKSKTDDSEVESDSTSESETVTTASEYYDTSDLSS